MSTKSEPILSEIDVAIGGRIRTRRDLKGVTQAELAKACGVTFQQIQKYERGTNRVSCARLLDISRCLDAPISYFYLDVDDRLRGPGDTDMEVNNLASELASIAARLSPADINLLRTTALRLASDSPAKRQ